jgi:hypothetical protein
MTLIAVIARLARLARLKFQVMEKKKAKKPPPVWGWVFQKKSLATQTRLSKSGKSGKRGKGPPPQE